jgi:probable DNA metabolism protein
LHNVAIARPDDFDGWRDAARGLLQAGVAPDQVVWSLAGAPASDLFATGPQLSPPAPAEAPLKVPRAVVELAQAAILHRDPERFALLYTLLWRTLDQPRIVDDHADPLVRRLEEMAKAVRRDIHKMRAFLRFRELDGTFVAWFEPEHHIVRANAGFFVRRFASMTWAILTPALSLHWDGETLGEGPGASRADAPAGDPVEDVWKTYYASTFNPARVKVGAMLKEMPRKYWKNMPETDLVPGLLAAAQAREAGMIATAPRDGIGANATIALDALREEAGTCRRCSLWRPATQTVFGEGPADAALMFVGEQPGDQEDLAGRPFVGPAGQLFDRALDEAGVPRARTYVTNAVKHFKFEPRGKRRIHAKPDTSEIDACRWWVDQERDIVRPRVTVALGATAARSLTGRSVTIGRERGRGFALGDAGDGAQGFITVHPSFLLRLPDEATRASEYARFVADLRAAWALADA